MRKILVSILAVTGGSSAFAAAVDYSQFQAFDNQVSIGYGMQNNTATGIGGGSNVTSSNNSVYLNAERLLNSGIWIDLSGNMAFGSGQNNSNGNISQSNYVNGNASAVPSNYGFNGKVGYAFPMANQHLMLTPYVTGGLNNNGMVVYNAFGNPNNGTPQQTGSSFNTSNQFYYTGGVGARLEYRINNGILVYGDQSAAYNWDQSGPQAGISPQDMTTYTSTVGAKFNIVKDFQLGVAGFYENYQPQTSSGNPTGTAVSQAQSSIGGLVTVGMTY